MNHADECPRAGGGLTKTRLDQNKMAPWVIFEGKTRNPECHVTQSAPEVPGLRYLLGVVVHGHDVSGSELGPVEPEGGALPAVHQAVRVVDLLGASGARILQAETLHC